MRTVQLMAKQRQDKKVEQGSIFSAIEAAQSVIESQTVNGFSLNRKTAQSAIRKRGS